MSVPEHKQNTIVPNKATRFVTMVLERSREDKGYAARMRKADNPDTEYQSWGALAAFGINLEKEFQRLPYVTVAASLARSKALNNGTLSLGSAVAKCYEKRSESDQAQAKIRRLLACDDTQEACRILRPLLTLIHSKGSPPLDYARLLNQLLKFHWYKQSIKAQWAQEFYAKTLPQKEEAP